MSRRPVLCSGETSRYSIVCGVRSGKKLRRWRVLGHLFVDRRSARAGGPAHPRPRRARRTSRPLRFLPEDPRDGIQRQIPVCQSPSLGRFAGRFGNRLTSGGGVVVTAGRASRPQPRCRTPQPTAQTGGRSRGGCRCSTAAGRGTAPSRRPHRLLGTPGEGIPGSTWVTSPVAGGTPGLQGDCCPPRNSDAARVFCVKDAFWALVRLLARCEGVHLHQWSVSRVARHERVDRDSDPCAQRAPFIRPSRPGPRAAHPA